MEYNKEYAKKVYAGLTKRGYTADMLGDETKFVERMADEGNRRYLYDQVQKRGDAKMGSWEHFNSKMMEVAPQTVTATQVEAEPQQGFLGKAYALATRPAADAVPQPVDDKSGYTFTAEELGIEDKPEKPRYKEVKTEGQYKMPSIYTEAELPSENRLGEIGLPTDVQNVRMAADRISDKEQELIRKGADITVGDVQDYEGLKNQELKAIADYELGAVETERYKDLSFGDKLIYRNARKDEYNALGTMLQAGKELVAGTVEPVYDLLEHVGDWTNWGGLEELGKEGKRNVEEYYANSGKKMKGLAGEAASLVPQTIGMVVGALTRNPNLMKVSTGVQIGSSMGQAAHEAKEAGAGGGQIFASALVNGAIEYGTERIPLQHWLKKVSPTFGKKVVSEATEKALSREADMLIDEARKTLGNKITARSAGEFAQGLLAEGGSEYAAEFLQTFVPLIYESPEKYPTLLDALKDGHKNGMQGFRGGLMMASVINPAASYSQQRAHDARRRQQGYVDIAAINDNGKTSIVEIIGVDQKGNLIGMKDGSELVVNEASIKERKRYDYNFFKYGETEFYKEIGYEQEPTGENAVKEANEYTDARNEVVKVLSLAEGADVDVMLEGRTAEEIAMGDSEVEDAVNNYIKARARRDGFRERYQEERDRQFAESDRSIDERTNNGTVYGVDTENGEVFITSGTVALNEEGEIDYANSEGLVVMFPDGTKKPVKRGSLPGKVTVQNAEEMKAAGRASIEERWRAEFESAENAYVEQQKRAEGVVFDVTDKDGTHRVEVVKEGDEMSNVLVDGEAVQISTEMLNALRGEVGVAPVVEGQKDENAEKVVEPVGEVVAPVVEAPKTALEQIPRNENNIPLYEQVDSELAWDGVVEEAGGNEETATVAVNSMVEDKKKALAAAEKAKAKTGVTIAEKIAAENERVANIEKAKADLAKWEEIAGVKAKRAAAQAENVAQPVAETAPVVESAPVEEVETPQATNEMQEADLTEDVKTEDVNETTLSQPSEQVGDQVAEGGNAPGQSGVEKIQKPSFVEEVLENGDKRITNYNSRGEVATVATERDGKVVSVDSYDEGVLFEHTEYDGNGKAASVTRYDKQGNAIGTQVYVDGKAVSSGKVKGENGKPKAESRTHPVADEVLAMAKKKQQARFANHAKGIAEKLGVEVTVHNDESTVTNKDAMTAISEGGEVKGWYNPTTGEIALFLPAMESMRDVESTILHEAVSHYGIKHFLGKEDFNKFLDGVWEMMPAGTRAHFLQYVGADMANPSKAKMRQAADEYVAHIAEKMDLNKVEESIWSKLLDAVFNALRKAGFTNLKRSDIETVIRASYKNLRQNGGNSQVTGQGETMASKKLSENRMTKQTMEKGFGGIWLDNSVELRNFTSAALSQGYSKNENYVYAGGNFYLYYVNSEYRFIPYVAIEASRENKEIIEYLKTIIENDGQRERTQQNIGGRAILARSEQTDGVGTNKRNSSGTSTTANGGLVGRGARTGKYLDAPWLYPKAEPVEGNNRGVNPQDSESGIRFRKVTPEMDAEYMAAVENGDMETAERLVKEAAKLAMPDTKVVDEDGYPMPMFHGDRKKGRYVFSTDTFFTPNEQYAKRYTGGTGEVYPVYLNIEKPFDVRDNEAREIFTEFNSGNAPVKTTTGALDWGQYTYEDLQEYIEENYPGEYDGFILDEGGEPDYNGNVVHRGLSYIPFTSNQAKYSSAVTYDDNGNVIPLSERFNEEKEDIRFRRVFHGSGAQFDRFDLSKSNDRAYGYGVYVAEDKYTAKSYARKNAKSGSRQLYEVDIPDDNGSNYLRWEDEMSDELIADIVERLPKEKLTKAMDRDKLADMPFVERVIAWNEQLFPGEGKTVETMYGTAEYALGSDKAASELLSDMGYVGISYSNNDADNTRNYVIFNEDDAVIEDRTMFRRANKNQDIFVSNAQRAVEGIKQEKATPEQWIAMLKKNGGLKAGEEAWLGLEEWLNEKQGAVTKQEILDFIGANKIQIEEVNYTQFGYGLMDEATRKLEAELKEIGWDAMVEKYPGFDELFEVYDGELLWSEERASVGEYEDFIIDNKIVDLDSQSNAINETREKYTTEGLERKREIALTVPTIEPYNASDEVHFGDAGGGRAVAWVRFGETTDSEGNRVLVIDEIQSKRHQDGREKGYKNPNAETELEKAEDAYREAIKAEKAYNAELKEKYGYDSFEGSLFQRTVQFVNSLTEEEKAKRNELKREKEELAAAYENLLKSVNDKGVPAAPFDKNWHELAMKRMLRLAAEEGFDKVAWTTGEQQAERYNIAKVVSHIECEKVGKNGNKSFSMGLDYKFVVDPNGIVVSSKDEYIGKSIADIVGKPLANKMLEMQEGDTISGDGLRIGGEGMKGFYDRMLPSFVSKYTKKWGAKVGEVTMPNLRENNTMHSVDVTPEMQESVMEGQTMFRFIGKKGAEKLDKAEEATTRLDNLNVAREMESAGKDAKAIKLATGWERGADGKWRYETEDELDFDFDATGETLGDYLDAPALFDAYPQIKAAKFEWTENPSLKGQYDPVNNIVRLNRKFTEEQMRSSLAHEIQHAIQHIEGFPGGTNPRDAQLAVRAGLPLEHQTAYEIVNNYDMSLEDARRWAENPDAELIGEAEPLKSLIADVDAGKVNWDDIAKWNVGSNDAYIRAAGEVESRNVQERLGMTPEERRNSLAEETEDVSREDQVFLEKNLGVSEETMFRKMNKHAEEFNKTHKGGVPVVEIDPNNMEADFAEDGFATEEIEELKERMKKGVAAVYNTDKKIIYLLVPSQDKESVYSTCWHEDTHAAIDLLGLTPEMMDEFYSFAQGKKKEEFEALLDKIGYEIEEYPEESLAYGVQAMYILDNWGAETLSKLFGSTAEGAQRQMEIIQPLIDYINNGRQGTQSSVGETVRDRGMYNNTANQKKTAETEGTGATATGGLTEEVNSQEGETLFRKNVTEEEVIEQQEENEESIAKDAVMQLGEALNAPVTIIEDLNYLPDNRRNKKGWFDPKTGEVVVVIPNHVSSEDAVQTVLHEVVGHRGLRAVLGEKFDEFLDDVFKNASPEVKRGISDKFFGALRKGHALTVREATEEYIAELAERGFEGYNGVWNSIKQWLKDAFRSLVGFEVTDNELRYLLWKSYNRQKSGPIETILDIAMEAKTGTGNTMFRVVEDYNKGVQGVRNKAKEGWYDEMRSIKVAQEAIEKELGREVLDSENVYLYANHLPSINKNKKEVFDNKYLKPFTSLLKKLYELEVNGQKMDEKSVERYTNAKHGIERNREMSVKKALTEVQDGEKVFNEEAYAAWAQERDAVRKRKLPWAEEQRELDKVAKKYGAKIRDYSGLTAIFDSEGKMKYAQIADAAYKYVADVESAGGKDIEELWKLIKGMTDYSLKEAYESGMMSKSTYDHIKQMYRYYVPLRGFTEQTAEDFFDYVEGDHSPLNAVVKTAKGRTSEAENIFATILNMANSAIVQGSKNRLKQRLLNLAMRSRTGLLSVDNAWYAQVGDEYIPVEYPENADEYAAFEERMKELEKNGEVVRHRPGLEIGRKVADKWNQQQHAVRVKRNGREYVVWVNGDPRLANAVNGMLRENFDETWIGALNRWRAQMVTQYSPTFIFTNLVRDVQEASMTYAVRRGTKMMGNFDLNVAANSVKMMSLYLKHKKGTLNEEIPVERYFKEFLENGGETGYTEMISIEQYEKQLKKLTEGLNMKNATGRAFEAVGEGVEFANRCIENLCRFSAYQTSREAGMSILKSIEDAKEVSVNFNRKGSGAMGQKWAKAFYMFLNPAIQSLAKRILLTKKFPKKMAAVWAGEFVMGATAPLLWSLIWSMFGDDEDKDELMGNYFNLTDYRRRSGLCLPGKDGVFHIPLSHEARALYGLGELFTSYVMGHEEYDNVPVQIFNTLSQSLPLNPLDGWAPGENILESMAYNLTPDAAKPIAEVIMNRDFAGNKVHNRSDFNEFLPEYMRGKRGTADIYKSISKVLSGKEIYGKGVLDNLVGTLVNPSTMEHLVEGYLGGAYSFADKAVKTGKWILGNEEYAEFKNVPIGSSFYTSLTKYEDKPREERTRRDWEDAFKFYQQEVMYYDDKETAAKNGEKNGEESGALVLEQMERNGEVLMVDIFNDGNDRLKELYSASDVARRNREFDKVQEIDKQIYTEKRDIVERMEKLADDPMIGYTFKRNKIKGVYGELETYGDVRDMNIINDFQTELQPIQDEYMKVEDWKAYKKLHEKELDMYEDLKRIESDISYEKSKMKENPVYAEEGMTEIRTLRAEAVELINKYKNE